MHMINGVGTTLYGKRYLTKEELKKMGLEKTEELMPYVATIWFCIFWIPLIPLESNIIFWEHEEEGFLSDEKAYRMVKINLNWNQVLKTGLIPMSILFLLWLWW